MQLSHLKWILFETAVCKPRKTHKGHQYMAGMKQNTDGLMVIKGKFYNSFH